MTLPEGLDAGAMLPRAVTARVAYVPGTAFYADGFGVAVAAAVVLLPEPGADPRGRPPAGRRGRGGAGAARHLRTALGTPSDPGIESPSPDLS